MSNDKIARFLKSPACPSLFHHPGPNRSRWLKQAAHHLPADMVEIVASGRSDLTGRVAMRKAGDMKRLYCLFRRYQLLFSCVTLQGLSDEAIFLYGFGFHLGLLISEVRTVVEDYNAEIRGIMQQSQTTQAESLQLIQEACSKFRMRLYNMAQKKTAA